MKPEDHYDVFVVPSNGAYIVYAPLAGRAIYVNADGVRQLRTYLRTGDSRGVDETLVRSIGGLEWLRRSRTPVPLPVDRHFHPADVTLFLTNRCNLRCSYCYAEAGEFEPVEMPESIYKAAIDLVLKNARRADLPANIGFHGGGEPTVAWDTLTGAMSYARSVGETNGGPRIHFGVTTNGVMSEEQAEFVADQFDAVTLSFDGPQDIQNELRPLADGGGSYDAVMRFVAALRKHGTYLFIRSTITEANVRRMADMVDFFVDHTPAKVLHFEPAFLTGRCRSMGGGVPAPNVFADQFMRAWDRARARGIVLRFSVVRWAGASLSFCGCAQDAFSVTPEGDVTACFEVCHSADPLANVFHYGRYDAGEDRFCFDMERLASLRSMNMLSRPRCRRCFARWNCLGDCPAKVLRGESRHEPEGRRCGMIQGVTKAILERSLKDIQPVSRRTNMVGEISAVSNQVVERARGD